MKKLSLMLVFVMLFVMLFALSAFAASFTYGPERLITDADVALKFDDAGNPVLNEDGSQKKMYTLSDGTTAIGGANWGTGYFASKPEHVLDGEYSTEWCCSSWGKLTITFKNEWEISDVDGIFASNGKTINFYAYAADGTLIASYNAQDLSVNAGGGNVYGDPSSNTPNFDMGTSFANLKYDGTDKSNPSGFGVKYIVLEHGPNWCSMAPRTYELHIKGRERIPSVGCTEHVWTEEYDPAPTCTEVGTLYRWCEVCLSEDAPKEVPALGHLIGSDPETYKITKDPDCQQVGEITFTCQREDCGEVVVRDLTLDDVTDYARPADIVQAGGGGQSSRDNTYVMFDNNDGTIYQAGGNTGHYVQGEVILDMSYYISSVTVWTGYAFADQTAGKFNMTVYYKVPGETEWSIAAEAQVAPTDLNAWARTMHIVEFPEVQAEAVKIYIGTMDDYSGFVSEIKVKGSVAANAKGDHVWGEPEVVEPSCNHTGYTETTCTVCGDSKITDPVPAIEHTWADATCEAPKTCSVCNKTEGNALGHTYEPGEQAEDGSVTYTCTNNCGSFYVINNSAVNGEYFLGTDALTFADGVLTTMGKEYSYENNLTTGMITTNDETIYFQVIEGIIYFKGAEVLHQHNEETLTVVTTDATCTEDGKTVTTCQFCGILSEEPIVAEGHIASWSEIREYVPATCMTDGYEKDICEVCKEEYTVAFPADPEFGHREIWGTGVGEDATCQKDGYYSYQCEICEETITDVYPANEDAHVWDEALYVFVPATCQEGGYSYNKCSLCGKEVTEEFEPSEWAHKYNNGVASDGVIVYTCTLCGDSYEEELDPALPYGDITVEIVADDPEFPWMVESVYYSVSVPGNYVLTINNEANVYVVYSDGSELIQTSTYAFTLAEGESITFSVMTSDWSAGTVELNLASADNAMLNGTYVTPDGSALFVFADGVLTVTDTNEMMPSGFAGTYTYNYNSVTGEVANSASIPMNVSNGVIFVYGRMPLSVYVPPMDVVLGDNEITVTNTNYFFDGIKVVFTATEAGTYVITASETGVVLVEGMYGSEMVELPFEVELAEGQAFEFIVTSSANPMMGENDNVVVNIAKKVTHVHVEEIIPAILPTPSVQGYTAGVKCSECDVTLVEPKAVTVTELADTKDPAFRIASAGLSLQDSIIVRYSAVVTAGYSDVYMVFEFNGEEYIYTEYDVLSNGRYQYYFDKPEASNMNDNINAYIYGKTAEGEYTMNKILDYSIKQYAINQLKKGDAKLNTVISDLLVMGAKTQTYSGYKANDLVTDAVIAAGYELTPTAYTGYNAEENIQALTGTESKDVDWKSAGVTLGSRTIVRLKFISNDLANTVAKITIAGETRTFTADDFEWDEESSRWMISIDYLTATQLNEAITATLELNGEQIGRTLTYSVNTYVCRSVDKASGNTQALIKALYVYGKSCESYFGK